MKIKHNFDKDKLFFTSDTHFFHKAIITLCNRPFHDEFYMTEGLIKNWNKVVPKDADIIVAGDFAFTGSKTKIHALLKQLNGRKWLILGNHCYQNKFDRPVIAELFEGRVMDIAHIKVKDPNIKGEWARFHISHHPLAFWERKYIHLHGHIHSGPNSVTNNNLSFHPKRYDIGVDNNDYTPISYHQLMKIIKSQILKYNEKNT